MSWRAIHSGPVLYAEDEEDDVFLLRHAFQEASIPNPIVTLPDGEAAIDYLGGRGNFTDRSEHPLPILLLLDINMPLVSGLEVLEWIRAQDSSLRELPALIFSSSSQPSDIQRAYQLGANGYLVKPSGLANLAEMVRAVRDYWLVHNQVPPGFDRPEPAAPGQ